MTTALSELVVALQAATRPSEELDAKIMVEIIRDIGLYQRDGEWWTDCLGKPNKVAVSHYTGGIDEALLLLPESTPSCQYGATVWVLPNGKGQARIWCQVKDDTAEGGWAVGIVPGNPGLPANIGATPAIALCIAALKARGSK